MSKVKRKETSCYCVNLRRAANVVTSYYDSVLSELEISVTQFTMMSSIAKLGGCSISDLACHIGLDRTTVVRTVKPLIKKGFVVDISSDGQRNCNIMLTEQGQRILTEGRPLWQSAQNSLEEKIGKEDMDHLIRIATKITE